MYIPKRGKTFSKKNIIQTLIITAISIAGVVIAILYGPVLFKVVAYVVIAILVTVFGVGFLIRFLTGRGYAIASAITEILYIFVAIPIIVLAGTYLPVAIYLTFFGTQWKDFIGTLVISVAGVMMVASVLYLIRQHLKDKRMGLWSYLKYLFDFERRAEERRRQQQRTEQIDNFYSGFRRIETTVSSRMEERMTGFKDFDWKAHLNQDVSWRQKDAKDEKKDEEEDQ